MLIDLLPDEIVVDNFAGGGGASTGMRWAIGRDPDVAINHDPEAIAMHKANHPATKHFCQNIWKIDPRQVVKDCGGKPVEKRIRDLAWVVVHWARLVGPRLIMLENVEEFRDWGPLILAENGRQMPCPVQKGITFKRWVRELKHLGYRVEWRELRACDYGAPTIRKRLYLTARRDGKPIRWPEPTHGDPKSEAVGEGRLKPWRTAAECIDWSLPCPSIFLTRQEGKALGYDIRRPLAEATMARIAKGVFRYVINAADPFIVPVTHGGDDRVNAIDEPLRTQTTAHRGEHALVVPHLVTNTTGHSGAEVNDPVPTVTTGGHHALISPVITKFRRGSAGKRADAPMPTVTANSYIKKPGGAAPLGIVVPTLIQTGYGERDGQEPRVPGIEKPLGTVVTDNKHAVVAAFLAQHNAGFYEGQGRDPRRPLSTVMHSGSHQAVVSAGLINLKGSDRRGGPITAPVPALTAQGTHVAEVRAFLLKYYGTAVGQSAKAPMHTATTRDRIGIVMVHGEPYRIVDIGMRMLTARERFNANGFPADYVIDVAVGDESGKRVPLTGEAVGRLVGNSVCPPMAEALVLADMALPHAVEQAGVAD